MAAKEAVTAYRVGHLTLSLIMIFLYYDSVIHCIQILV